MIRGRFAAHVDDPKGFTMATEPDNHEGQSDAEPANEVEATIMDIWKVVFDVDTVGRHDNFFDLGGHSLNATEVAWRMGEAFGLETPVRTILDKATVAELAQWVISGLLRASAGAK